MKVTTFAVLALTCAVTLATVAIGYLFLGCQLIGIDDANIFLTYAQNLARGWGFVFIGGGKPVEGFTSLAWVVICAIATRLSSHREAALLAVNVGLVVLTVVAVILDTQSLIVPFGGKNSDRAGLFALAVIPWCFLGPDYVLWMTLTLMDTALWGTVVTLGALATAQSLTAPAFAAGGREKTAGFAVLGAVAVVTRPESMVLVPSWIAIGAVATYALGGDAHLAARRYGLPAAVFGIVLAALVGFRIAYFGYPLPNTYYAKVSPSLLYNAWQGIEYFSRFVNAHALVAPVLACAVVATFPLVKRLVGSPRRPSAGEAEVAEVRLAVVSIVAMIGVALPLFSGGDHFAQFRFFQPVWPLLIVPALVLLARLSGGFATPSTGQPKVGYWAVRALLGLGLAVGVYSSQRPTWHQLIERHQDTIACEFEIAVGGRETGSLLNQVLGEGGTVSIGVVTAGGIAVSFHGEIIDLMGLNDVEMGHSTGDRYGHKNHAAFNQDVFFIKSPDLVLPTCHDRRRGVPEYLLPGSSWDTNLLKNLFGSPLFRSRYILATLTRGDRPEATIACWVHRERIDDLIARGVNVEDLSHIARSVTASVPVHPSRPNG